MTPTPDPIKTIEEILNQFIVFGQKQEPYRCARCGASTSDNTQDFCWCTDRDSSGTFGSPNWIKNVNYPRYVKAKGVATQAINNELLRARQELFDLYGTPVCDNLHHIKKHQHRASEECPVVKRLTQLKQSQTEYPNTSNEVRG